MDCPVYCLWCALCAMDDGIGRDTVRSCLGSLAIRLLWVYYEHTVYGSGRTGD